MFYNKYRLYTTVYEIGRAGTTKTGPNDARHVIWALGEFFFHSFSILDDFYRYYGYYKCTEGLMEHYDNENGSKRREIAPFGP